MAANPGRRKSKDVSNFTDKETTQLAGNLNKDGNTNSETVSDKSTLQPTIIDNNAPDIEEISSKVYKRRMKPRARVDFAAKGKPALAKKRQKEDQDKNEEGPPTKKLPQKRQTSQPLPLNPLITFFEGSGRDHRGRSYEMILQWNDNNIERIHDFIQRHFPLQTPSANNPQAALVNRAIIDAFNARQDLRDKVESWLQPHVKILWLPSRNVQLT